MAEEKKNYERRSVKSLESAKRASAHQKEWFMSIRERVENGEPFIFAGGFPLEIANAMDIPCVISQWWVAICTAKQRGEKMFGFLDDAGYRSDVCSYCISGLACALDPHPEEGPWGGLPRPTMTVCVDPCQNNVKIYELMAEKFGTKNYTMSMSVATEADPDDDWWVTGPHDWDKTLDPKRVEHAYGQLKGLVHYLENETGRKLDLNKLRQCLAYGNEQNEWFKKARDLVATTRPAPVAIADTVGAIMQAQWHKGTKWGRDHAKMFYEEIKARVDAGVAGIKNEKIRLMWVGRGLWFNLAFYQHFEEKYGAGFIWSMYTGTSDMHVKYAIDDDDPLRALAARECQGILHIPPWNNNWYLKEAKLAQVDGVVYLVPENCMNNGDFAYFITKQFEDNGIPVSVLRADPVDDKKWNQEEMTAIVEDLIENRIIPNQKKKAAEQANAE